MKIYLDDTRKPPDDTWTLVRWPDEAIELLKKHEGEIEEISLGIMI